MIALTVRLAGPEVNPFALGEIDAALALLRLPDRRYQHVGAQQILELFRVAAGIILVVQEEGTLNRNSGFGILMDQLLQHGSKRRVDLDQARQAVHAVLVVIILEVGVRAVAFMGAHDRRKGCHLSPAEEDLLGAGIVEEARIAADVAVGQAAAAHPGAQRRADDGAEPVVTGEVNALIPGPEQCAVLLAAGEAGAHEVDYLAELSGFGDGVVVALGPERRPVVVLNHGTLPAVQNNVVRRQIFAEVRHPAVNADVEAAGFDDLVLEPVVGFRIGQVNNTAVELAEIDQIDAAVAAAGEDAGLQTLPQGRD